MHVEPPYLFLIVSISTIAKNPIIRLNAKIIMFSTLKIESLLLIFSLELTVMGVGLLSLVLFILVLFVVSPVFSLVLLLLLFCCETACFELSPLLLPVSVGVLADCWCVLLLAFDLELVYDDCFCGELLYDFELLDDELWLDWELLLLLDDTSSGYVCA